MEYFWLILAGLVGGVLGGMGMGGGTLLIPILTIFLNINQINAQGINLLAFIPMAIIVIIIYAKNKLIDFKISFPIIIAGVLTSIGGSFLANIVNTNLLRTGFGIFLVALGLFQGGSLFIFDDKKK